MTQVDIPNSRVGGTDLAGWVWQVGSAQRLCLSTYSLSGKML